MSAIRLRKAFCCRSGTPCPTSFGLVLLVLVGTCFFGTSQSCAAEKPIGEPLARLYSFKENNKNASPYSIAGSEQSISVVYTVRIVHSGEQALQEPEIRMRLPITSLHQDIDRIDVEGEPQREFDRWKEPSLFYRRPELGTGQALTGRWTVECRIRELRWDLTDRSDAHDAEKTPNYAPTVAVRMGWWFSMPPAEIRQKVAAFRKMMQETPAVQRRSLIDDALKINHPFVLPWLDDLLYDPETRVETAAACLKIGGKEAFPAVVDSLARLKDPDGDRRIGELLNTFSGERFGPDRKQWKKWIKTHTPPSPLPKEAGNDKP
jgi:hypothetical protein